MSDAPRGESLCYTLPREQPPVFGRGWGWAVAPPRSAEQRVEQGAGAGRGVSRTPTAFKHLQWTFLSASLYFQRYQELPGAEPVGDSGM